MPLVPHNNARTQATELRALGEVESLSAEEMRALIVRWRTRLIKQS